MDRLIEFARGMRKQPTKAEALLWVRLRDRQLGLRFRRQHPIGPYIVDFFCRAAALVVELDGDPHADPETQRYDEDRDTYLASQRLRVLRVWNSEVFANLDGVLEEIWRITRSPPP